MAKGTCKNCGADECLHQAETMLCPWAGVESPVGRPQRWSTQTYQEESNEIYELQKQVKTLRAQVRALLDAVPSAKVEE